MGGLDPHRMKKKIKKKNRTWVWPRHKNIGSFGWIQMQNKNEK